MHVIKERITVYRATASETKGRRRFKLTAAAAYYDAAKAMILKRYPRCVEDDIFGVGVSLVGVAANEIPSAPTVELVLEELKAHPLRLPELDLNGWRRWADSEGFASLEDAIAVAIRRHRLFWVDEGSGGFFDVDRFTALCRRLARFLRYRDRLEKRASLAALERLVEIIGAIGTAHRITETIANLRNRRPR